jgi:hypothetical protein
MKPKQFLKFLFSLSLLFLSFQSQGQVNQQVKKSGTKRYLYVAVPGIRDYLGYGGHGVLVFDMDNGHKFVKRIKTSGLHPDGTPSNVKGIAVSIPLNSLYVSTIESLQRIDLSSEK